MSDGLRRIARNLPEEGTEQPIAPGLARDLRAWPRDKPPGLPALPVHHETAKAMRRDLEAAGIPYATDEGIADFHSLRGFYISSLIRSGASIKTVQVLARHSNPSLTLARYARINVHDVAGAVDSLPDLSGSGDEAEPMARTGTDSASALPVRGSESPVGRGRAGSVPDASRRDGVGAEENPDGPQVLAAGGVGRVLAATDGDPAERGGFEPPIPLSQYNGLANRRFRPLSHLSGAATGRSTRRVGLRMYQARAGPVNRGDGPGAPTDSGTRDSDLSSWGPSSHHGGAPWTS